MQAQADQPQIETVEVDGKQYRGHWVPIDWDEFIDIAVGETWSVLDGMYLKDGVPSSWQRNPGEYFKWVPEPSFVEGHSPDSPPAVHASSTPKPEFPEEEVEEFRPYDAWDLLAHHDTLTAEAYELMQRKNNDYAGADGASPFKNFLHAETLGLCSVEQGMVVRLSDKLQRLAHAVSGQEMKVTDESVRDTILDIINYSVLISAYLKSKVQASS